jgi:hypothetical protein
LVIKAFYTQHAFVKAAGDKWVGAHGLRGPSGKAVTKRFVTARAAAVFGYVV